MCQNGISIVPFTCGRSAFGNRGCIDNPSELMSCLDPPMANTVGVGPCIAYTKDVLSTAYR